MKTSIGQGKTIEHAIEAALQELGATREQVEIEIVQEPTKGFLGLRSKEAVVRVSLNKASAPSKDHKEKPTGTVSVQGGQLDISLPDQAMPPTLIFGSELRVLYHGEVVKDKVELVDGLEPLKLILPERQEPELTYEIRVDQTKTKAELFWKRIPGVSYQLADHPATNRLHLTLQKTEEEAPSLNLQTVSEVVQIEGLKFGLKLAEIEETIFQAPQGLITIAEGKLPIPPENPSITYVFQEDAPAIDPDAIRIDHYEVHGIRAVKPGAVLAVKRPGKAGVPGKNVYGEEIPVEPLREVEILVGEGVALTEDNLQAVATITGLPTLQGGVVKVTSVFELEGNADVSTGNISMDGTIIVKGNVLESVKVESKTSEIIVNGLVSGALLKAGGSITVSKNVIRSRLIAGGQTIVQIQVLNLLFQIGEQLEGLIAAYNMIVSQADNIPFENLVKHILELKFFNLPKDIEQFSNFLSEVEEECSADLLELRDNLMQWLCGAGLSQLNDINILKNLLAQLRAQELRLEEQSAVDCDVTVGYLQNSRVEASRYGEVTGRGCFYSTVLVGKGFKIPQGVVRGGEVIVNSGNVLAKELGGPTGITTTVEIVKEGRVDATLVHPNVIISIGEQSFRFDETSSQVKVFLSGGVLTVYSGSNKIHG